MNLVSNMIERTLERLFNMPMVTCQRFSFVLGWYQLFLRQTRLDIMMQEALMALLFAIAWMEDGAMAVKYKLSRSFITTLEKCF